MNIRYNLKLFLILILFSFNYIFSVADWTVLIYVQAKNNLSKFATQNLYSMSKIGSDNNLNILVQWYQPGKDGVWRYQILKDQIKLDSYLPINSDGTNVKDLVDSMDWAVKKYPANKNFLILWNHGVGIVDPIWQRRINYGTGHSISFGNEQTINLTEYSEHQEFVENELPIKIDGLLTQNLGMSQDFDFTSLEHRGILFNEQSRTYLNNEELLEALKQIKTNVLKNKKLDIFGMDACLMSMVEIGYLAKGYAKYMISSQEVELAYGWNYIDLLGSMKATTLSPIDLAKTSVISYQNFYKNKIDFYTQSVVDLDRMDDIKDSINSIVLRVNNAKKISRDVVKNLIKIARRASIQFTNKSYIDLHSFYTEFLKQIDNSLNNINNAQLRTSLVDLKTQLNLGKKVIESVVIAKTAGQRFPTASGLSIYFPVAGVDNSYYKTNFVKECLWLDLIKDI
ncbi:MAG: Peptidase C11 clostripain [candidate division TM6 bacterium GW2011_GWF2_28_16]|jgi:hypothetical protein|nr:MAG: Peptidase C11 clostripain [candidate division TM6 bacterium GW2011_GWF2_28_16]